MTTIIKDILVIYDHVFTQLTAQLHTDTHASLKYQIPIYPEHSTTTTHYYGLQLHMKYII